MEHLLWVEKYRPARIEDCILPDGIKETFQEFVKRKEIPNLLLSGTAVNQSKWTTSGTRIYYNTGNVTIGTTTDSSEGYRPDLN